MSVLCVNVCAMDKLVLMCFKKKTKQIYLRYRCY